MITWGGRRNIIMLDYPVLLSPWSIAERRSNQIFSLISKEVWSFTTLRFGSSLTADELKIVSSVEHKVESSGLALEILCDGFIGTFVLSDHLGRPESQRG